MKKVTPYFLFVVILFITGFDDIPGYNQAYTPVFMLRSEMEKNVKLSGPESIFNPGKIYIKDNFIFINEKYRGVHVIDNSNPEDPTSFAFIQIDGCIDMAVKNNVLYADNAVDLIAIRYNNDMTNIEVTERIKNVFPELLAPDGHALSWQERQAIPEEAVIVRWEVNN